ncbi:hypothetical protein DFJ67_2714 [Asanoa ferruginea]|uniref:Uncharacterized protein n=1 Tax=Asanoa ferruginea TaxID=53367 RepID=A0A3D9ZLB2_9ACTN|nr:hypothetical protein DFJ67_2714 [Asanoa ferruginea]
MLGGLAVVSHRTDPPTVREQRDLAAGVTALDQAVGLTVGQAGPRTVPVIMPVTIDKGCRITPLRSGATATGVVRFFTATGGGADFLTVLANGYPAAYQVEVSTDRKALRADAGEFVALRGKVISPEEVQVTLTTGCRPVNTEVAHLLPEYPQQAGPRQLLTTLGATSVDDESISFAACPAGRPAVTASALGHGVTAKPTAAAGDLILNTPKVYAYRSGPTEAVALVPSGEHDTRAYVTQLC